MYVVLISFFMWICILQLIFQSWLIVLSLLNQVLHSRSLAMFVHKCTFVYIRMKDGTRKYIMLPLKRCWAFAYIWMKKGIRKSKLKNDVKLIIKNILEPCSDNSKIIMNENSCDSVFFYGADQKGNSLFVKMTHRVYHKTELILQVTLSDGRVYVLPDCPDTIIAVGDINQKWSASGLKIESLEPRQRWRITYNGFLRNQCRGNTSNNDNVEHIRLNFIFISKPRSLEWPDDWSIHLHADALVREPWKHSDWMHKMQLIDDTGFDLWGSISGQITFKNSNISEFYLRGLCQRRWGKHESCQFHKTITIVGVTQYGAMYYLGVSNTKHSFSHMQFGHLQEAGGMIINIDRTDLELSDFEKEDAFPTNYKIAFKAGKLYSSVINNLVGNAITYYNDQPWACTIQNLRVQLNGNTGVGLMITCCPYTGPSQIQTSIAKIQRITRPDTFAQKNKYILRFDDTQCQNESVVGGKGYSLAILTSIDTDDFAVPSGFCVTSFALERQLQHHKQLQNLINDIVDSCCKKKEDLESCCQKAVIIIQSTPVEKEIAKMILQGLEELESFVNEKGIWRYAVRSSAIGEDSEETSAAGQNSTYLGVKNASDIIKCVAKCWASLFSYQSVEYRRQNGLPIRASMGVCVQRMVDAEAAGVMFTRHPTTGDPSSIVITANYGLGETVVSGKVEPDTFMIHRKWDNTLTIDSSVLGNKKHKILLDDDNGVITSALSEQEIKKISISNTSALRLAKIGLHLESLFGSARDVEWAIVDEQIYMLQARPITTINAWTDFEIMHELDSGVPCDVDLMTFANIGEVLPHPISPLSISTVIKVLNLSLCAKFNKFDCCYLHMVGMRCAMNYLDSTLQDVNKELTMTNKIIDLAICGREVTTPEVHIAAIKKYGIASIWRNFYTLLETIITAYRNNASVKKTINIFNNYTLDANEFDTPHDLYNTLNEKYEEIYLMGKGHNLASLVSVFYQTIAMSILTNGSDNFTSDHLADIALVLSSCTNVISTEVPIALDKIAACIRRSGKADEFSKLETAKVMTWLELNCPPAAEKLQLFFKMHGHRGVQEMDLFTEPWVLKPDNIINTIQVLAMSIEENYVSRTLSVEETITSLKTPISLFTKYVLRVIIPWCRKAVTLREMTKNVCVSAVHILRLAYRRLGVLMVKESYIPDEQLIFFLTHQEIGQLLNKHNQLLLRKALRRRKIYQKVAKFEYPEFSTGMPVPIEPTFDTSSYEGCTKIEGTSVCGDSVLGRACVITDLSEAKIIQHGDILITYCTDIGWSPYFPLLAGIVTELGGLISHGAVVAREYGLPCIVGAKGATQVFKTGDTALLSGDGTLQLIKKA
ncbi:PREDICTED: prodigiosin synthesizing transferase PigC-like isoform X2 [Trachymyrmex septentrionalis]|uniref:prodigiosin synthesizing transferase PigC-like isoform X2 n=1 Tax=Trachymyrmex septentrionalis TaxID=34720 RepID=UPI00084F0F59|nr:PREDICTED: prodigiosin synthesizing transferase PigC-like isoform X2 [Trachymyrmex septentrionalis]